MEEHAFDPVRAVASLSPSSLLCPTGALRVLGSGFIGIVFLEEEPAMEAMAHFPRNLDIGSHVKTQDSRHEVGTCSHGWSQIAGDWGGCEGDAG